MVWTNKSSVMTVVPWADGFQVMPWGSDEVEEVGSEGSGFGSDFAVGSDGSGFGGDGNGSQLLDTLTKLDRELCGNITDDYLQVIWKTRVSTNLILSSKRNFHISFLLAKQRVFLL